MANQKNALNLVGLSISIIGIVMLFISDQIVFWFIITLIGAMLIGGLPKASTFTKILKASPVNLVLAIALTTFYIKFFGQEALLTNILGIMLAIFVTNSILIKVIDGVFR